MLEAEPNCRSLHQYFPRLGLWTACCHLLPKLCWKLWVPITSRSVDRSKTMVGNKSSQTWRFATKSAVMIKECFSNWAIPYPRALLSQGRWDYETLMGPETVGICLLIFPLRLCIFFVVCCWDVLRGISSILQVTPRLSHDVCRCLQHLEFWRWHGSFRQVFGVCSILDVTPLIFDDFCMILATYWSFAAMPLIATLTWTLRWNTLVKMMLPPCYCVSYCCCSRWLW